MAGGTGRRKTVGVFKGLDVDLLYKAWHSRLALFELFTISCLRGRYFLESAIEINVGESCEVGDISSETICD